MPTDVENLMEMGFSENRAQKALAKTGYKGVHVAMDWLFAHENDPDIDEHFEVSKGNVLGNPAETSPSGEPGNAAMDVGEGVQAPPAEAKSLKCDECGKVLRTELDVQVHASRTGHSNFSESTEEIKPLTAEEKEAQLAKVQELIKQKRVEKEEREKQEQILREKHRRTQGKEFLEAKQKVEADEMKKLVEQRRRDKEEEKRAKQRVREQIEKDKRDRAVKFGSADSGTPATADQTSPPPSSNTTSTTAAAATAAPITCAPAAPKEYKETRIQIRLSSGESFVQTFNIREQLAAVRMYVLSKQSAGSLAGSLDFTFATTFPRKVFTEDDMLMPLNELGLVPSAVLLVTAKPK